MNEWKALIQKAEKEPQNAGVWEEIMTFAQNKLNKMLDGEVKEAILDFFKEKKEPLPTEIEIKMGKAWEHNDYYTYLSAVLVDGEEHPGLKEELNNVFDLETLSNNPVVHLD